MVEKIKNVLGKLDKFKLKMKNEFKFKTIFKQKIRINTLTIELEDIKKENEKLKLILKDKLYEEFIKKYDEPEKIERLEKENKRLRKNNKELKESLKNGE